MWENVIVPGRPQMTIWGLSIACWIPKATNTHSEYVILLLFQGNNIYKNAPECYVICGLLALLNTFFFKDQNPGDKKRLPPRSDVTVTSKQMCA